MTPNMHWCVHIPDQILDYGPVYGFWCFLGERLNKLLKNYNTPCWNGGRLELSMMRALHRDCRIIRIVSTLSALQGLQFGERHAWFSSLSLDGHCHSVKGFSLENVTHGFPLSNLLCRLGMFKVVQASRVSKTVSGSA